MMLTIVLTLLFLLLVFYYDTKYRVIPNRINGGFLILALVLSFIKGEDSFILALFSGLAGFLLLLIPYAFGWVGGGDVKMLGTLGSLAGFPFLVMTLCYGLIIAGILAFLLLLLNGGFNRFQSALKYVLKFGKSKNEYILLDKGIPLGSCISLAGIASLLLKHIGGIL